jgi:hypothetical protein
MEYFSYLTFAVAATFISDIYGISKKTTQSLETDNQERLAAFELYVQTDYCCLVTFPPDHDILSKAF